MGKLEVSAESCHARELRKEKLKLSMSELFALSGIPVRTIEDYEAGRRKVPQRYLDRLQALYERDQEVTRSVIEEVKANIDRLYPNGIPSEVKQ